MTVTLRFEEHPKDALLGKGFAMTIINIGSDWARLNGILWILIGVAAGIWWIYLKLESIRIDRLIDTVERLRDQGDSHAAKVVLAVAKQRHSRLEYWSP